MSCISVIVPIYKVEPYLRECIDSILAQTFRDFELILVDDGSPDRCGEICDEYAAKDPRIIVIHQKNGGLSAARNAGIDIASGDYLTFIDSDDWVHAEYLERLLNALKKTDSDIAIGDYSMVLSNTVPKIILDHQSPVILSGKEACWKLYGDNAVKFTTAWGKLVSARLFSDIRFPISRIHEDEATTYKLLYTSRRVCEIDDTLYFYRVNESSIMHSTFSVKRYDAVTSFQERAAFYYDHNEQDLFNETQIQLQLLIAKLAIFAAHEKREDQIPMPYRISKRKALKRLYDYFPDDKYCWYLSLIHPKWVRPHEYIRKIKKTLHIPCK